MWALVDANSTSNAQGFRDVRFTCLLIHDDAFLPVSNRWTIVEALIIALLWLTVIFLSELQPAYTHLILSRTSSSKSIRITIPSEDGNERGLIKQVP